MGEQTQNTVFSDVAFWKVVKVQGKMKGGNSQILSEGLTLLF